MYYQPISFVLWLVPILGEGVILAVIAWRKLHRELPWFSAYLAWDVTSSIALWPLRTNLKVYIPSYWLNEAIASAMSFLVIYEVYAKVLREYPAVWKLGKFLFRWAAVLLIGFAILSTISAPSAEHNSFAAAVLTLERSVHIVQCGLLLFLFLFASFLKLHWTDYVFGIALGFAISITTELAVVAIRANGGPQNQLAFLLLKPAAYNCAVMIWVTYLLRPRKALRKLAEPLNAQLFEWDEAISGLLGR